MVWMEYISSQHMRCQLDFDMYSYMEISRHGISANSHLELLAFRQLATGMYITSGLDIFFRKNNEPQILTGS